MPQKTDTHSVPDNIIGALSKELQRCFQFLLLSVLSVEVLNQQSTNLGKNVVNLSSYMGEELLRYPVYVQSVLSLHNNDSVKSHPTVPQQLVGSSQSVMPQLL